MAPLHKWLARMAMLSTAGACLWRVSAPMPLLLLTVKCNEPTGGLPSAAHCPRPRPNRQPAVRGYSNRC